jgi:hypothetical protein
LQISWSHQICPISPIFPVNQRARVALFEFVLYLHADLRHRVISTHVCPTPQENTILHFRMLSKVNTHPNNTSWRIPHLLLGGSLISAIIVLHRVICFHTCRSMNFPEFIPILSYSIANAVLYQQRVRCFPLHLALVKAQQTSAFCDVRHSFGDKWVMSSVVDRQDDLVDSGLLCWDYAIDAMIWWCW